VLLRVQAGQWRLTADVLRSRFSHKVALSGACLLATVWLTGGGCAYAQVMVAPTDPLAPKLQSDPRKPAPTFQRFNRAPYAQAPASSVFTPPASGAGRTGFDSTNSRKTRRQRNAKPKDTTDTQAIAPGVPQPPAASPFQTPPKTGEGAFAQAPGAPPVPEPGPIRKPLPKRKALEAEDPYAALGLRVGSFDLFPATELIGGYDTNPSRSPNKKGAAFYTTAPELRAQSNWSRHELKADLRGSYTGYSPDETPTLSRPNFDGKVDGRIDVTHSTRIDLGGRVLVATDNPNSPNLPAGIDKLPVYVTYGGSAGVGQRFNRFDLSVKGDVERTSYQDSTLVDGSTASNEDRNYDQYGGRLRGGYELSPGVTPFVEVGIDRRKHDLNADFFGYQRDSKGTSVSVGTTFEMPRLLTGDLSIGYVKRTYEDPRLSDLSGLIGNASLIWQASALTTVKLTASSSIGESTIPGVSGVFYRDVGLQIDHAFRQWLIGTVKLGVGMDTYKDAAVETSSGTTTTVCDCSPATTVTTTTETITDRIDKRYAFGLGLTYKLNRNFQLKGEYRQEWLRSNVTGVDYDASIFLLGMRFQK
jgi:hypothetical protein